MTTPKPRDETLLKIYNRVVQCGDALFKRHGVQEAHRFFTVTMTVLASLEEVERCIESGGCPGFASVPINADDDPEMFREALNRLAEFVGHDHPLIAALYERSCLSKTAN